MLYFSIYEASRILSLDILSGFGYKTTQVELKGNIVCGPAVGEGHGLAVGLHQAQAAAGEAPVVHAHRLEAGAYTRPLFGST